MNSLLVSALIGSGIPVLINVPTFLVVRRMIAGDPLKLMKANIASFLVKIILYGIATAVAVTVVELNILTFAGTFSGVFVLLHIAEALYFKRLLFTWNSE